MGYGSHEDFIEHTGGFVGNTIHRRYSACAAGTRDRLLRGTGIYRKIPYAQKGRQFFLDARQGPRCGGRGRQACHPQRVYRPFGPAAGRREPAPCEQQVPDRNAAYPAPTCGNMISLHGPLSVSIRKTPGSKERRRLRARPNAWSSAAGFIQKAGKRCSARCARSRKARGKSVCEMQALCKGRQVPLVPPHLHRDPAKDGKAVRMLGVSENIDHEREKSANISACSETRRGIPSPGFIPGAPLKTRFAPFWNKAGRKARHRGGAA